ncbi:unnamed protein product [[Candida] boidinii]|nr:unnamed protein product [[Candida] boidinii]
MAIPNESKTESIAALLSNGATAPFLDDEDEADEVTDEEAVEEVVEELVVLVEEEGLSDCSLIKLSSSTLILLSVISLSSLS